MRVQPRRRGAAAVEAAIVLPILFLLVSGIVIGGVSVFRSQQVETLSREGARWASVRGCRNHYENDQAPPTAQQIVEQAIRPKAMGMDVSKLVTKVEWIDKGTNTAMDWDVASKDFRSVSPAGEYVSNTVRITVTYETTFLPFFQPVTVRSVCELPMTN